MAKKAYQSKVREESMAHERRESKREERAEHRAYPYSEAFDLAPNAGVMDGGRIDHMARSHGEGMNLSSGQHVTDNAMLRDWDGLPYSQHQRGDGSMDYESVKEKIAGHDAKKLERSRKADY